MTFNDFQNNIFSNLSNIFRFSNTKLIERESDSEHTIKMQLLALFICEEVAKVYDDDTIIDREKLMYKILVHDLDEVFLADIPRNLKYYDAQILGEINRVTDVMMEKSGFSKGLIHNIKNAKKGGDIESFLVKKLDVLQCIIKLFEEYNLQRNETILDRLLDSINTYNALMIDPSYNQVRSLIQKVLTKIDNSVLSVRDELIHHKVLTVK